MNIRGPTTNLFALLFPWRRKRLVDRLGGEAAMQCRPDLRRLMYKRAAGMSTPEIRGYARAQAAELLAAEVERIADRRHLERSLKQRILAAATEQLVGMAVRDAIRGQPVEAKKIAA